MTPYGTKTMELAERLAGAYMGDGWTKRVPIAESELRQHIEPGEKDCRTCEHCRVPDPSCLAGAIGGCINFSQYKRADYTPLCEVTK